MRWRRCSASPIRIWGAVDILDGLEAFSTGIEIAARLTGTCIAMGL